MDNDKSEEVVSLLPILRHSTPFYARILWFIFIKNEVKSQRRRGRQKTNCRIIMNLCLINANIALKYCVLSI